LPDALLALLGW